jgi:hypothetical protein
MIVTLYKNSQTEGEKKSDIYSDLWQLSHYEPATLFNSGFTSEKAEYVIPNGYEIIKKEGEIYLQKANYLYEIFTNKNGKPGLKILNGGTLQEELYRPGEEPKEVPKEEPKSEQKSSAWVPQMINGEWEIY